MLRWLLIVPFLLLPLACDDDSAPPPQATSGASSGACAVENAGCAVDSDCCSGLNCNVTKHTCQNNATCKPVGEVCSSNADCCGAAGCSGGYCKLPGNSPTKNK